MSQIAISKDVVRKWSDGRKLPIEDVIRGLGATETQIVLDSFEQLEVLSRRLAIRPSDLLRGGEESDLDDGVRVCRSGEGPRRTLTRDGLPYYTYQHLVTTSAAPTLMPLRVTLHCTDESAMVLNGGHDCQEIVYVTRGVVRMHWGTPRGVRTLDLSPGDSAYLQPGVPHSFIAVGEESELIALNV